ncbi:MAG: hypothetical protein M3N22_09070, partial [Acidobacteriota bacterium]|nr:hypothetical protein [Acidobacteriota bacterium]
MFLPIVLAQQPAAHADDRPAVQTQMRNVTYHFSLSAAVHIKALDGELVPLPPAEFPVFDQKDSFLLRIKSAEITMAGPDLANIL